MAENNSDSSKDTKDSKDTKPTGTKAPEVKAKTQWRCQGCTVLNALSAKTCSTCDQPQPAQPPYALFGEVKDTTLAQVIAQLIILDPMDKRTMSGRCGPETDRMEKFMMDKLFMKNTKDFFVQGVRAFELTKKLSDMDDKTVIPFEDKSQGASFNMSVAEIKEWQQSYRVYASSEHYPGKEGKELLRKSLEGKSESGDEAWRMKFVARISKCPIFMAFDSRVIKREVGYKPTHNIFLVSVSGVDFAGRIHDIDDIKKYVTNWNQVYQTHEGDLIAFGRDFMPLGVRAKLDKNKLLADLQAMARIRLRGQDEMGIQVVVETGIGLGVFSGDGIGCGELVRQLSTLALRTVLEEEGPHFKNIKLVVCSLPIFKKPGVMDNYHYFVNGFKGYKGLPVLMLDNDMHAIALMCSEYYPTSELNPADSHGVFGEYWQNKGPGTEEKLALTTGGLLCQHHVVNPHVLNMDNYHLIDPAATKKK